MDSISQVVVNGSSFIFFKKIGGAGKYFIKRIDVCKSEERFKQDARNLLNVYGPDEAGLSAQSGVSSDSSLCAHLNGHIWKAALAAPGPGGWWKD